MVVSTSGDGETFSTVTTTSTGEFYDDVTSLNPTAKAELSVRFKLQRATGDATAGPVWTSYQLRATPVVDRQRDIQLPLLLVKEARDRKGNRISMDPYAVLAALEEVELDQAVVLYQDLNTGETVRTQVEQVVFAATNRAPNSVDWGGVAMVTLRTVL